MREHTALALGDTLAAIRAIHEQGVDGREPATLAELARLAAHAQVLDEGLQEPLVGA